MAPILWTPPRSRRLRCKMSFIVRFAQENDSRFPISFGWWPEVSVRLAQIAIAPDFGKSGRNYDGGRGEPVMPTVRDGWRHTTPMTSMCGQRSVRTTHPVGHLLPARTLSCGLPR